MGYSKKILDVIIIGDLNMDFILNVPYHPSVQNLSGSSNAIRGSNIYFGTGGAAANTASALSALGNRTGFIGVVGNDFFGKYLVAEMERKNIDMRHTRYSNEHNTGLVFRFEDIQKQSVIYASPGPQDFFENSFIPENFHSVNCVYLSGNILTQSKTMGEKILSCIKNIKDSNRTVILDPGRFWLNNKYAYIIEQLLEHVDILLPNKYEAELLTNSSDPINSTNRLFDMGISQIIIKMGKDGAIYISPTKKIIMPAYNAQVDSTFGAGDAFNAGFIHGLLKKWEIKKTIGFASVLAGLKVQTRGAQEGVASENDVLNHLENFVTDTS